MAASCTSSLLLHRSPRPFVVQHKGCREAQKQTDADKRGRHDEWTAPKPNLKANPGPNFKYTSAGAMLARSVKPLLLHTKNNYASFFNMQR